jgi:hypothetical protein
MRRENNGTMQKQAACIVLPKKTLVGPSDLSSKEVPEENGKIEESKLIYIEKTSLVIHIRLIVVSNTVQTDIYYNI